MLRRIGVSLVLAFVAVAVASSAEPVTHAIDYDNVHIRVLDPEKAASWYVSALGAKLSTPPAPGTAQVTFGANVITITKGSSVQTSAGTLVDHIGLSFSDLDAAVKTAAAAGAKGSRTIKPLASASILSIEESCMLNGVATSTPSSSRTTART